MWGSLFSAKSQLKKGRAVSFLPLSCISCHDSLWLCKPCLVRVPCGFRHARGYLLPIKTKFQSVKKNTSQWDSEMFCVSNAFQVLMVLQRFFDTPFIEAAIFFHLWLFERQSTLNCLYIQLLRRFHVSLTQTQSQQLWF